MCEQTLSLNRPYLDNLLHMVLSPWHKCILVHIQLHFSVKLRKNCKGVVVRLLVSHGFVLGET